MALAKDYAKQLDRPNPRDRAREQVALTIVLADVCIFILLLATLSISSSLTLLTEATRAGAVLVAEAVSVSMLRAVHRRRFAAWSYGVGKIESLCNLLGCTGLIVGGLWIAEKILVLASGEGVRVVPSELALAAVAAAITTAVNGLALVAMKSVWTADTSAIFVGQYRARKAKFGASLSAQVAITLAALAYDPEVRVLLDAIGAAVGAGVMIYVGVTLGSRCIAALLDLHMPPAFENRIMETIQRAGIPDAHDLDLRTRNCGRFAHVEVTIELDPTEDFVALRQQARAIEAALLAEFGDSLDVSIDLRPAVPEPVARS